MAHFGSSFSSTAVVVGAMGAGLVLVGAMVLFARRPTKGRDVDVPTAESQL